MNKPPIEDQDYTCGVNVVDIGDVRVSRGITRRPASICKHKSMSFDTKERRVWCKDCEQEIDPFDAFQVIVASYDTAHKKLKNRIAEVKEAEQFTLLRRATKALDKVWRGKMLPCCVNCGNGMLPEDYVSVEIQVSREWGIAQRRAAITNKADNE